MSYCLKEIGGGHIWSFDHDKDYAEKTRENLRRHSLIDLTTTIYAPLREVALNGEKWLWYDTKCLEGIGAIDLLFIDGPPRKIQKMARYPALPLLIDSLNEGAVIILDDTHRADDKETLKRWLEEFECFDVERYDTESGTAILRKKSTSRLDA
jgi:predicted O-methyltransferase YrrM